MKKKAVLALEDRELDKAVRIRGTQYDRKRKLTDKQIQTAQRLFNVKRKSYEYIALKMNVDKRTIRYHCDEEYRKTRIKQMTGKPGGNLKSPEEYFTERVAYKRQLVAQGKIRV